MKTEYTPICKEISFKDTEELKDLLKKTEYGKRLLDVADEFLQERVIEYKSIVEDYEKNHPLTYITFYSKKLKLKRDCLANGSIDICTSKDIGVGNIILDVIDNKDQFLFQIVKESMNSAYYLKPIEECLRDNRFRLYFSEEYYKDRRFNDAEISIKLKNTSDDLGLEDIINTLTDYMLNHENVSYKLYI